MKRLSILTVAALLASAPAAAQQDGHETHDMGMMQGGSMQHCMAMMGGPHPQMLLHHQEALELTPAQVSQLEDLRQQAGEAVRPRMQPAMQAHMAAAQQLRGESPDLQAYEENLREAADHMVQAHVGMARVAMQAREVLTPEQQAELRELGTADGMMEHDGHQGMMMGEEGHGGMGAMMGCMMMGAGEGHGGGHNR